MLLIETVQQHEKGTMNELRLTRNTQKSSKAKNVIKHFCNFNDKPLLARR